METASAGAIPGADAQQATRTFRLIFFGGIIGIVISVVVGATLQWRSVAAGRRAVSVLPVLRTLPAFSLTDQRGDTVSLDDLAGKVWVADFIFTRCAGPCPQMTRNMADLEEALTGVADVRFVSFTLDPLNDTPKVLNRYADLYDAGDADRWYFLTGDDEAAVYDLALKGFALTAEEAVDGRPIIHSQRFVVVDREGRIRRYTQDGTDPGEIRSIVQDVKALLLE